MPLDIDDFDAISRAHAAAVRPQAGRQVRRHRPLRGRRRAARRSSACSRPACCTSDAITVTGRTIGEHADEARETPGQQVVRPLDDPLKPTGGLAILRGNLAPEGCVVKLAGHERRQHTRPGARLRVRGGRDGRGHRRRDRARRRRRDPQRGPGRRAGHARDARGHGRAGRARGWGRSVALLTDGRFSRRDARLDGRPRRARGARAAARSRAVRDGDEITIDVDARRLDVALSDEEIAERVAAYEPPAAGVRRRA